MSFPEIKDSLLDKAIATVAPGMAVKRRRNRMILAVTGGYEGARRDKRGLTTYNPMGGSADADINFDLDILRNRTRDLNRNNPIGGGAIHTVTTNVVGTGLRLNAHIDRGVLNMTEDQAKEMEQKIERGFRVFEKECDLERTQSFFGLQSLAFRSTLESGDAIVLMPFLRRAGDAFGLKLQVIEGDRLCNPNTTMDTATIRGGVEIDPYGAPVRYHILNMHPGEIVTTGMIRKWEPYAAFSPSGRRQVLHLYRKERPGQHRGVPYLAPVIEILKQLGRYTEAEVMAAVVQGMFTVFTHTESGQGMDVGMPDASTSSSTDKNEEVKMGYGAVIDMGMSDKIDFANPGRPNTAFDPFVQAILRQVGMALELPYEVLVKHFTASYSAARAAILEAWSFYLERRAWLVQMFCRPVYEAWMTEAIARGYLYAPGFNTDPIIRQAYLSSEWIGAGMKQIDPVKEVAAAQGRIDLKLTTRPEECQALTGTDWEGKLPQIKRETEMFGTAAQSPKSPASPQPQPDQAPNQDETGDMETE
jgi:lambda family phage portal protein